MDLPRIAIATGDPAGIGPEIALKAALDVVERAYITWVLQSEGGNKTRAAELLNISPKTLLTKLRSAGLED